MTSIANLVPLWISPRFLMDLPHGWRRIAFRIMHNGDSTDSAPTLLSGQISHLSLSLAESHGILFLFF